MSNSYAKFFTSMLNDEWFVSLSCNARGLWMQLILIAKQVGDTGVVSMRSYSAMAVMCGCDDSSAAKYLRNFAEAQKINILPTSEKTLTIEIVNYAYYQRGDVLNDSRDGEKSREEKRQSGEKSPYKKTREDRDKTEDIYTLPQSGTYARVMAAWNVFAEEVGLDRVKSITDKRAKGIKSRLSQEGFDAGVIYDKIRETPFLLGDNDRGWKCDFDFVWCSPEKWVRIIEGKYLKSNYKDNWTVV